MKKQTPASGFLAPVVALSLATAALFAIYAFAAENDYKRIYYSSVVNSRPLNSAVNSTEETTPQQENSVDCLFQDVSKNDWFCPFVAYLYKNGIVTKEENFYPARALNRAEAATMIVKAVGGEPTGADRDFAAEKFRDLQTTDWHAGAVGYLARRGWISGYPVINSAYSVAEKPIYEFKSQQSVSKAELLKLLAESYGAKLPKITAKSPFQNVNERDWYSRYAEFGYRNGLVEAEGGDSLFDANKKLNRAEAAKIITRADQNLKF